MGAGWRGCGCGGGNGCGVGVTRGGEDIDERARVVVVRGGGIGIGLVIGLAWAQGWYKGLQGMSSLDSGSEGLILQSYEVEAALRDALGLALGHDHAAALLVEEQRAHPHPIACASCRAE